MADSSQAQPALDSRALSEEVLGRLPIDLQALPKEVRAKLEERARAPDRRLMVGRYVVIGELGRGGMGVVYEAWDPQIERRVAIKTIEPELVAEEDRDEVIERFKRETKIVGRLHHPGIVVIYDYGEEREKALAGGGVGSRLFYYVMEYLEGYSLARTLRERRMLPDVEAVEIVAEVLEALHVSHNAGVIHRDIKPSNIFLRTSGEAVLLDFGIAKTGSVALTRQGQILGTPSYLAPERLHEKESPVDGRADIFSLGVLLFTMLTGEAPFVGEDVYDVIDKIAKTAHPKLARTTPSGQALSLVLDRMLAKKPEDRYQNAFDAAEALRGVLLLLKTNAEVDSLLVQSVRIRDPIHEGQATEIATPSSAMLGLDEPDEADTGRHAVHPSAFERPIETIEQADATPANSSTPEDMIGGPSSETPVRLSELLGTVPELSLQRETRELDSKKKQGTPPPLPRLTSLPQHDTATDATYDAHHEGNDETTDDQTIADPDAGRRPDLASYRPLQAPAAPPPLLPQHAQFASQIKPVKAPSGPVPAAGKSPSGGTPAPVVAKSPLMGTPVPVKASHPGVPLTRMPSGRNVVERQAADTRGTDQILRAGGADHSEQKTEQDRGRSQRNSKSPPAAPPRNKRSRIEASLVDEEEVVVKPAPMDSLKPDELPTQTGFRVPSALHQVSATQPVPQSLSEEVVKARGDSRVQDPADQPRDEQTLQNAVVVIEEAQDPESLELDAPRPSAAVARKTIGARGQGGPKSNNKGVPIQVRVIGNVSLGADRMRMVRRRGFMLLAAMLAAIAVGLLLGRLKQRTNTTDPPSQDQQLPSVEPRARNAVPGATEKGEPDIVKPPPPSEILEEAAAAFSDGRLELAEKLYDSAARAAPAKTTLRAQALLGHGDTLRALDKKERAIEVYKELLNEHQRGSEAESAKVALSELGVQIIAPVKRTPVQTAEKVKEPKQEEEKEKTIAPVIPKQEEITPNMPPEEKCRIVMARTMGAPDESIPALRELLRSDSKAACAYWHLAVSYGRKGDDRGSLEAFKRFLEVDPNSTKRGAVEQRIQALERKLQER